MSTLGVVTAVASTLLAAATLAGLVWRWRVHGAYAFAAYLASVVACLGLLVVLPGTLWTWTFVALTDAVQRLLALAVALEFTVNAYRALPHGRQSVRRLFTAIVAIALATLAFTFDTPRNAEEWAFFGERVSYVTALLFAAYLTASGYSYVPLDPLHREVALGFMLLAFLVAFRYALTQLDPLIGLGRDFVSKTAYPLILAGWVWAAWRPDPPSALSPALARRLHPWRTRA